MHLTIGVGRCSDLGADRAVARIFSIEVKEISAEGPKSKQNPQGREQGEVLGEDAVNPSPPAREYFQSGLSRQFSVVYCSL